MKKILFISFLLLTTIVLQAKDITIQVKNKNSLTIDVYVGVLTSQQNNLNDEDLVNRRNELGIANLGESVQANKEISLTKKDVKKERFIVIFGQFNGGGRTEIKRYKSNDIWSNPNISIIYEPINTITPNNSFVNIIDGLKHVNNTGAYIALENIELLGTFLLYRDKTDTTDALIFPIIPKIKATYERLNTKSTSVEDILSSEANATINIEFPMSNQVKGVFGASKIMSLEWVVVNSGPVIYKPENGSYYDLFLSCSEKDKKIAFEEFSNYPDKTKLLFIRNAHLTDTVRLETYSLSKIEIGIQVQSGDIADVSGNYKRSKSSSLKSKEVRIIKDVFGLDVSVILKSETLSKEYKEIADMKLIVKGMKSEYPDLKIAEKSAETIKKTVSSDSNKDMIDETLSSLTAKKVALNLETIETIKKILEGQ